MLIMIYITSVPDQDHILYHPANRTLDNIDMDHV